MEVTNNNQDYTTDNIVYSYQDPIVVSSIVPSSGMTDGGTIVTVSGLSFYSSSMCQFGSLPPVAATVDSSMQIQCQAPATAATGRVPLEISNNNQDFTTTSAEFTYYVAPHVTSIDPTSGPTTGNTVVSVYGTDFRSSDLLRCQFHTATPVPATFVTSSVLACISPAAGAAGSGTLEVSNNNQDYTSDSMVYTYYTPPTVVSLDRSNGPENGGSQVLVSGTGFRSDHVWCKFDTQVVRASYLASTQVVCISPSHTPNSVPVEISNNRIDYTSDAVQFVYQPAVMIASLQPSFGPAAGNTEVTLTGAEFVATSTCKFASTPVTGNTQVTVDSSSMMRCMSPSQTVGAVQVEVTGNNQDYTALQRRYVYYGTMHIHVYCLRYTHNLDSESDSECY